MARKKLAFKIVLWASTSPILLAGGHLLLVLIMILLEGDLQAPLPIGQVTFNRLSLYSDQHPFSPNNIHTLSREMVMRINNMIT